MAIPPPAELRMPAENLHTLDRKKTEDVDQTPVFLLEAKAHRALAVVADDEVDRRRAAALLGR